MDDEQTRPFGLSPEAIRAAIVEGQKRAERGPESRPRASGPQPVVIHQKLTVGSLDLGWGDVFTLAFRFTVAMVIINVPIVVSIVLLTR